LCVDLLIGERDNFGGGPYAPKSHVIAGGPHFALAARTDHLTGV
jgi:hypothetical protein